MARKTLLKVRVPQWGLILGDEIELNSDSGTQLGLIAKEQGGSMGLQTDWATEKQ